VLRASASSSLAGGGAFHCDDWPYSLIEPLREVLVQACKRSRGAGRSLWSQTSNTKLFDAAVEVARTLGTHYNGRRAEDMKSVMAGPRISAHSHAAIC